MLASIATDKFLKGLEQINSGRLHLTLPDGRAYVFQGQNPGPEANLNIHDPRVPLNVALRSDNGFADDYRLERWSTDNLENLMTLALMNDDVAQPKGFGRTLAETVYNISYYLKLNTLKGSRRNIHAHYDLGNDFYKLWLDPTMTYSSALFSDPKDSLVEAQNNKYDRIVDRLGTSSGSVLEVGCGWGGFAERACSRGDFAVKGITLSDEQQAYASNRLGQNASIVLEDYRHQKGKFDSIVSIEMFEAVGERFWQTYFGKMSSLLKSGGKAVVQTITIEDRRFETYRKGSDFIRSFIFPGGMLPSPTRFTQEAAKAGLRVNNSFDFGRDYARTLEHWLASFDSNKESVKNLGFDDGFIRLWRFYLATCIAGFRTGRTGVMQVEMQHA